MVEPAEPAPRAARVARAGLLGILAFGPAAWLLLRPLLTPGLAPGARSGGVYEALHRYWAVTTDVPPRFPEPGAAAPFDALALALAPLTRVAGASVVVTIVLLAATLATALVAWRYALRHAPDPWTAAAATAAFTASPALVSGVAGGELDAWHGWAALAPSLCATPAALIVGIAVALVAPTVVSAAVVPALLAAWLGVGRGRFWPIAGLLLGVVVRIPFGWPEAAASPGWEAWFAHLSPPPSPARYGAVYVGFVAAALLLAGLSRAASRPACAAAALALAASALGVAPAAERLLLVVPLYAALAGLPALRLRAPGQAAARAVLGATALVGEGWKGVSAAVPLDTAPLADAAPIDAIADGPVLDLPATGGAARRALWLQSRHGQPVAVDATGRLAPSVVRLSTTLADGGCADPSALGFRTVVARREGAFRELGGLRACLGEPTWDDGVVAVWRLGVAPVAPAISPGTTGGPAPDAPRR